MKKRKISKRVLRNMGLATQRQFKQQKRRELRDVQKAMDEFTFASAWVPGYEDGTVDRIRQDLAMLKEKMSVKNWGR